MYLRTTPRRNNDGSVVRYLQLAHNTWDPTAKRSRVQVLYNFGREDDNNRAALQRLVASITRFLDPDQALAATAGEGLAFVESRPLGGTWVLDGLWHRLGIDQTMRRLLAGRRLDERAERVLFGLICNRALAPSSKLAAAGWISDDVAIPGLAQTSDDACYRAMDWLLEIHHELEHEIFGQLATLLDLEVDLLFFDTTSTYFELDEADTPTARDQHGHRLPQPSDAAAANGVPTAGFRSYGHSKNRRYLRKGDHHYIIGERLRSGSAEATAALQRQGRYQVVADNLRVKEVRISDAERFVICHNPEQADRDAAVRERLLAQLQETITGSDRLPATKRAELRGVISTKPGLHRYLRVTPGGLLRLDQRAIKAETNLDGTYLLRSSDPHLSVEDIALGYKQLLQVERGWRDMNRVIDLRPVYDRKEDRIRAHVLLCWLALLLTRTIETICGDTWPTLRRELERIKLSTFAGPGGTFRQRTETTSPQRAILAELQLPEPPRVWQLTPAAT